MQGVVFDIKQMAVYDGPGIRMTIFLKGCPLNCSWCHNPEGLSAKPQLMVSYSSCMHCGKCEEVCPVNCEVQKCKVCGLCIDVCPLRLRRIAGTIYTAKELAGLILRDKDLLESMGGGVTFSGGEPMLQYEFLLEVVSFLKGMHCAVETSGYCSSSVFRTVIERMNFIMMDLKIIDSEKHKKYCGKDNKPILSNLRILKDSGKPFVIRIPLIPGVNDSGENLESTARLIEGAEHLQRVELLKYQKTAGAKYEMVSKPFIPGFDEEKQPEAECSPFIKRGIPYTFL